MDLRNFSFHSGYPIDKVIGIKTGSYTILNQNELANTVNVPHGLPGKPLAITVFSNSASFTDTYDEGFPQYVSPGEYGLTVRTTDTNIQITGWSLNDANKTVYWRTILLENSLTSMDVKSTASQADTFQFNTAYNYSKLVKEGSVTATTTVTHNLNFIPQALVWMDNGTWIERMTFMNNDDKAAELTLTTMILRPASTGTSGVNRLHYRIYGDD